MVEVAVYCDRFDSYLAEASSFQSSLSKDEKRRLAGLVRCREAFRFLVCRGVLRRLLSERLMTPPGAIRFGYSRQGKPSLLNKERFYFNVSHSREYFAIAICEAAEVGIDIEYCVDSCDVTGIARNFFHPSEYHALLKYDESERIAAFYRCWVRKEAFMKAWGVGLSLPLKAFSVPIEAIPRSSHVSRCYGPSNWVLCPFDAPPGYASALVVADTFEMP